MLRDEHMPVKKWVYHFRGENNNNSLQTKTSLGSWFHTSQTQSRSHSETDFKCPPSGWPGRRSKCCSIPPWCWRWCVRSGRSANVWREWCFFFLQEILGGFLVWEIWGVGFLLAWGFQGKTPEKSDVARVGASISRSKRNKWWKKWSLVLLDPVLPKKKSPKKRLPNVINRYHIHA